MLLDESADVARRAIELRVAPRGSIDVVMLNDAPAAPAYRVLRGLGNVLVHAYADVDPGWYGTTWRTSTT